MKSKWNNYTFLGNRKIVAKLNNLIIFFLGFGYSTQAGDEDKKI